MPRRRSKAKGKDIEQCGPPYFVQGRPNQRNFYFVDVGDPVGSALPFPKAPQSNGDQPSQINCEMDIGVTDDGTTFERPTTNEKPKKRNASISESPNQPPKKLRVPGGRAPVPKRVTAELDSEDEIIVSMKQAGKTCTQIAKRLRDEGRINYRDKTITSRYVRIMKARAEQMEKDAAKRETQWQEDDARSPLTMAVDKQLVEEIEKLTNCKWQRVVGLLRALRPEGIFSKAECERRFNRLVKEKELDTGNSETQPRGSQASASQFSVSQPDTPQFSASQSNSSKVDRDIPDDELSSPREADPGNCDSNDSVLGDQESSGGDDDKYKEEERNGEGSGMDDERQKARARRKSAPCAGNDAADGAADGTAEAVATSNRGLRATTQKIQGKATSSSRSEHHLGTTIATGANLITESGILADGVALGPYDDVPDTAVTISSVADTFAATSDSDVIASITASCSEDVERRDYVVGEMIVCGRVVPEPAAAGRRLHVQNLPCWATPDDLQMIFYEFNFTGSICENCDEGAWFVDVATANDATRAVVTLNKQLIMNELISVVVYRHPDMLGFNFGQWPMIID